MEKSQSYLNHSVDSPLFSPSLSAGIRQMSSHKAEDVCSVFFSLRAECDDENGRLFPQMERLLLTVHGCVGKPLCFFNVNDEKYLQVLQALSLLILNCVALKIPDNTTFQSCFTLLLKS